MVIQIIGGGYMSNKIVEVQNIKVNITHIDDSDYICISDKIEFDDDFTLRNVNIVEI